jgi:hypothetical protein
MATDRELDFVSICTTLEGSIGLTTSEFDVASYEGQAAVIRESTVTRADSSF